ncbi:MAG: hypothetical protein ACTSUE_18185 [Promethearchaeota archaeon]
MVDDVVERKIILGTLELQILNSIQTFIGIHDIWKEDLLLYYKHFKDSKEELQIQILMLIKYIFLPITIEEAIDDFQSIESYDLKIFLTRGLSFRKDKNLSLKILMEFFKVSGALTKIHNNKPKIGEKS